MTIRSIFNRQVGRSIHSNPFAQVSGLAVKQPLDKEDGVVSPSQVYSPENVRRLIDAADGLLEKTILQSLCFTGLRHGELLGLKWVTHQFREGRDLRWTEPLRYQGRWITHYRKAEDEKLSAVHPDLC